MDLTNCRTTMVLSLSDLEVENIEGGEIVLLSLLIVVYL